MDFKESKAIYLQIADRICDEVLTGTYAEDERIPSVREYAACVEVNANTAMRSYDYLQSAGIISMKRGIGYFVVKGAREAILASRKKHFMQTELQHVFHQLHILELPIDEVVRLYAEYEETLRQSNNHQ